MITLLTGMVPVPVKHQRPALLVLGAVGSRIVIGVPPGMLQRDPRLRARAGDGEKIICEDNDGWRWEPA
jgi:hypothetical protein